MKKKFTMRSIVLGLSAILLMASCSKDDNPVDTGIPDDSLPANETWVVWAATSGWAGGVYALKDNKSREINLDDVPFLQLSSVAGGRNMGRELYKVNSTDNKQGVLKMRIDEQGNIVNDKFLASLSSRFISNYLLVNETEGYYWDEVRGGLKVQKFNPTTMERTGEIDFSSLSLGLPAESVGQLIMAERDGKLYVDLLRGELKTGDWQVTPNEQEVAIAVYDLRENKLVGVTTFPGTTHLGVFIDHVLYSIDAVTKDMYFVAVGNMKTQPADYSSKILRIKNGETTFDPDFTLDIKDYQFVAEFNRLLAHNNKIYTTIPSRPVSYYGGGQHGVRYRSDVWYWSEIDVNTKRATRLPIPADSFYGTSNPFLHNGEIYFLSNNTGENFFGVNQYNPETGVVKETFRLKDSGRLNGFNIIVD